MPDKKTKDSEAAIALGTVSSERAFHFYKAVGQPLGMAARSLSEFAHVLKGLDPSSVKFHVERGDFENWFKMLGDNTLANQVASLKGKMAAPEELKGKITAIIKTRIDQLQKTTEKSKHP